MPAVTRKTSTIISLDANIVVECHVVRYLTPFASKPIPRSNLEVGSRKMKIKRTFANADEYAECLRSRDNLVWLQTSSSPAAQTQKATGMFPGRLCGIVSSMEADSLRRERTAFPFRLGKSEDDAQDN